MDTSVWEPLPQGPRLKGRRIIVTGAAAGMGRAIAQLFAHEGARLALFDVTREALDEIAKPLGAHGIVVDVSSPEAVAGAVEEADRAMGGIDGVVNAAGILRVASFADTEPEMWRRVQDVNLFGPYLVCRAALPALQRAGLERSGRATIVNISSMGGIRTPRGMIAYAASKAGLIAFTSGLALELAPGIRANAICPGVIKTPMTDAIWRDDPSQGMDLVRRSNGLGRKGTPMEVAYTALFLTSDESSFTSGSVYTIDGGPAGP
jgi:NAD(P)-dependent dehydrogenase (short-subunit alcohol dehydrogenase family)